MRNLIAAVLALAPLTAAATGLEIDIAGEGANGTIVIDLFDLTS